MYAIAIRTDKPVAELYLLKNLQIIKDIKWEAYRELAETLHIKIDELLKGNGIRLKDLDKVIVYSGPGSFTGLRIGVSIANALSYSLQIPIIGEAGEKWLENAKRMNTDSLQAVVPEYGSEPHITQQKK